jgi:hypothetical protein
LYRLMTLIRRVELLLLLLLLRPQNCVRFHKHCGFNTINNLPVALWVWRLLVSIPAVWCHFCFFLWLSE